MPTTVIPGYIAGHYTITWNAKDVGYTEDGFNIRITRSTEMVQSDNGGDAILDEIYRGGNVYVEFTGLDYTKILSSGILLNTGDAGVDNLPNNLTNQVGKGLAQYAKQLVCTHVGGNATLTYTFYKAVLATDITIHAGSRFTKVPVVFLCYPDGSNNDDVFTAA